VRGPVDVQSVRLDPLVGAVAFVAKIGVVRWRFAVFASPGLVAGVSVQVQRLGVAVVRWRVGPMSDSGVMVRAWGFLGDLGDASNFGCTRFDQQAIT
jgi:hypothetical protein